VNDSTSGTLWPEGLTYASPLLLDELRGRVPADLQQWCDLANQAARLEFGCPDTCVLTSHALAAFLREMGREPELVRIEAHPHARCRCDTNCHGRHCRSGGVLGWDGDGTRRPAAGPGMWHGHLGVACDGYLLDPTIDQVSTDLMPLRPLVFPLPPGWDKGASIYFTDGDGNRLYYVRYRRQVGWKSAGDARPSHWRRVVDLMLEIEAGAPAAMERQRRNR